MSDEAHFIQVLNHPVVQASLRRNGFEGRTWAKGGHNKSLLRNDGLQALRHPDWLIRLPAEGIDGITVHFEARHAGELQVDVEVFPYEGSIAKDAARMQELREHLRVKGELIDEIRTTLKRERVCVEELGISTSGLLQATETKALCAVKFLSEHGQTGNAESDALFIARVIDHVTPLLDPIVRERKLSQER